MTSIQLIFVVLFENVGLLLSRSYTMKRSSSWKNLQKTFASTPIIPKKKRAKISRKSFNSSKSSLDETNDFQIEDSDEENVPCDKQFRQTPLKALNQTIRPKSKPLLINTTINSTITEDDSIVCCTSSSNSSSSSENGVDNEPVLRDVSECKSILRPKVRSKSLLFLSKREQNRLNPSKEQTILKDVTPIKQQPKANPKNVFNKSTINSRPDLNETIIESDSFDENDSPKKSNPNMRTEIITRQHSADIVFTQSVQSSNPVIESVSSQFSLNIESPKPRMQTRRMKSKKHMKGGLVEQLNKVLNNNKSEYSFWINDRTTDVIEPGEKMRINIIEQSYGRVLLHCSNVDNSSITSILCVDPSFKKLTMLQLGKIIEVGLDTNGYDIGNGTHFYPNVTKILV